ncbi:hypothetical protein MNB_SUP05-5-786 [hydrothermal vent metagenome]|uniref:NYN domain-containing protein n=1 Tax=hydrothermal vent metagenome TaxID=652676 RepID=A0A1W1BH65_9ZZZZ
MKKVVLLIDAGYLQTIIKSEQYECNVQTITKIAHACYSEKTEELSKILYYDCDSFNPIDEATGKPYKYLKFNKEQKFDKQENKLIKQLAKEDLFAIRLGILKFDGWNGNKPKFRQKGVDMRIGLDIAHISHQGKVDRIILITGDTDFIPAMKYARKFGIQIVLTKFTKHKLSPELQYHTDFTRILELSDLKLKKWQKK